jgi:hypothetical protein
VTQDHIEGAEIARLRDSLNEIMCFAEGKTSSHRSACIHISLHISDIYHTSLAFKSQLNLV